MSRQALGKGLEALIPMTGDLAETSTAYTPVKETAIDKIDPNPFQPRQEFDPRELDELTASIREKGIVQPLIVRSCKEGRYELLAGERRLRAAKLAGLAQVPINIRAASDSECLEIALIENLQRSDLNPLEEAQAYQQLITRFELTQDEMAKKVGKDRSSIANTLRLLKLPESVQHMLKKNRISEGHARALLSLNDPKLMERWAQKIVRDNLSVREIEYLVAGKKTGKAGPGRQTPKLRIRDPHTQKLEDELCRKLGTKVRVLPRNAKKGKIEIEYYSLDDLDRLLSLLR